MPVDWLTDNWGTVVILAGLLASLLNSLTPHWSQASPGVKRAMLIVLDVLSFVGSGSKLKLPGRKTPENEA